MEWTDKSYRVTRNNAEISPEEVFQDSAFGNDGGTQQLDRLESPVQPSRFIGLIIVVLAVTGVFVWQLTSLQVLHAASYRALADATAQQATEVAPRGLIKDRNGEILVANTPSIELVVDPRSATETAHADLQERLPVVLDMPLEAIATTLDDIFARDAPAVLVDDITREQALDLSASWFADRGVVPRISHRRLYPDDAAFAHLLGYTGRVQRHDLEERPSLHLTDVVGRIGIERAFDQLLRGSVDTGAVQAGQSLRLTIDAALQRSLVAAMETVATEHTTVRGAAVALDPRDGSVRALASLPGFDANLFSTGISTDQYQRLAQDPAEPLFNRSVSGQYPPGSTIKPFVAIGGLAEGVIDEDFRVNVTGAITVPNRYNPNIVYTFRDWKAHGLTDIRKAIAVSSNVFFYIVGGGYQDIPGLGINRLISWLNTFGFGAPTGIALEGEADGLLPTPEWKQEIKNEPWTIGDTYHAAIGQGDVQVTPLQLARATAAIANGGMLVQPHLIEAILDEDGNVAETATLPAKHDLQLDEAVLTIVQEGMRQAVLEGSAQRLQLLSISSAGKTGTSQVAGDHEPHAWFTGFFPYDNPELVVTVVIENAGGSSTGVMPAIVEALQTYFEE